MSGALLDTAALMQQPVDLPSATVASITRSTSAIEVPAEVIVALRSALNSIPADDRDAWIAMGCAVKELGNPGRGLWLDWSQTSAKFEPEDAQVWDTLGHDRTGYAAVFARAQSLGWVNPQRAIAARSLRGPASDPPKASPWSPHPTDTFSVNELLDEPPAMQFVAAPYLPAGCAAIITGPGGSNKTGVMAVMSIAVCTGRPLFGSATMQGSVFYVSAEDRRQVFQRHMWANTRTLDEQQRQDVAANFHIKDVVGLGFKLTRHIEGQTCVADDIGALIDYAKSIPNLRLICLDTLSRLNGGDENNEDLARIVEAMERIARGTGAAVLIAHHTGKAQMRDDTNDQYSSRGGSALSDNARSAMNLTRVRKESKNAPINATAEIAEGRLLCLSHVKSNYAPTAADVFLERVATPHAAQLVEFAAEQSTGDLGAIWLRLKTWFATQTEVRFPNARSIDGLGPEFGSRSDRRSAIDWALDRGKLLECPHPEPQGRRKAYLKLRDTAADAESYRRSRDGE